MYHDYEITMGLMAFTFVISIIAFFVNLGQISTSITPEVEIFVCIVSLITTIASGVVLYFMVQEYINR